MKNPYALSLVGAGVGVAGGLLVTVLDNHFSANQSFTITKSQILLATVVNNMTWLLFLYQNGVRANLSSKPFLIYAVVTAMTAAATLIILIKERKDILQDRKNNHHVVGAQSAISLPKVPVWMKGALVAGAVSILLPLLTITLTGNRESEDIDDLWLLIDYGDPAFDGGGFS